jgi:hypothetical protein
MIRSKRNWILLGVGLTLVPLIGTLIIFLLSARIPNRWQELAAGMNRSQIAEFLANDSAETTREATGRDAWRIKRPIGDWLLLVSYNADDSFHFAHLRYASPILGEYTRARNYGEKDDPYPIRAQR